MNILLDTNTIARIAEEDSPRHEVVKRAIDRLRSDGETLLLVPQAIYEFWVVATRTKAVNGLGMTTAATAAFVEQFRATFTILPDDDAILDQWLDLVRDHGITGVNAHDARLVAAMRCHGITEILTFNDKDFRRYENVTVIKPDGVITKSN
ncbi:type II toxin-antitoxin system VapC family toxin [Stratiformator vulcanicus]|nr:type II toxin-antitoxin system VapC family toxin [Stratiformator vulcanicus]